MREEMKESDMAPNEVDHTSQEGLPEPPEHAAPPRIIWEQHPGQNSQTHGSEATEEPLIQEHLAREETELLRRPVEKEDSVRMEKTILQMEADARREADEIRSFWGSQWLYNGYQIVIFALILSLIAWWGYLLFQCFLGTKTILVPIFPPSHDVFENITR